MGKKKRVRSIFNRAIKEARRKGHRMRESLEGAIKKANEKEYPKGYRVQILFDHIVKEAWFVEVQGAGYPTKKEALKAMLNDIKTDPRFTAEDIAKFRADLEKEIEKE